MQHLTDEQRLIVKTIQQFVEREVIPVASRMEHRGEYPHALVETMKELGLFGLNIPEEYGGAEWTTRHSPSSSKSCPADGWALPASSGRIWCCATCCPLRHRRAEAAVPAARSRKENYAAASACPSRNAGTDLQAITTTATRRRHLLRQRLEDVGHQRATRRHIFLLLAKTDPQAQPASPGMSAFVIEKGAAGTDCRPGYRQDRLQDRRDRRSASSKISRARGEPDRRRAKDEGFKQVMTGLEAERLNVAARGLGVARAAFDEAIRYAQQRTLSESRSPNTRRFRSSWRKWQRRSRRRGC